MLDLQTLAKWLQPLCEKHRRAILLRACLHKATSEGVYEKYVIESLEKLDYTYDSRSGTWILL